MKKVLFATTALVATAGVASADVALSGSAQMGIMGGENMDTQFVQDIDITFTMSGTTDNGLTFGAAIDLDESASAVGTDDAGVAIFISGSFGTLTMGDTNGALDFATIDAGVGPASINDDHTSHAGYYGNSAFDGGLPAFATTALVSLFSFSDNEPFEFDQEWSGDVDLVGTQTYTPMFLGYDGQILSYSYSAGSFGVLASVQLDDDGLLDPMWGVGATYTAEFGGGSATFGAAYQSGELGVTWTGSGRIVGETDDGETFTLTSNIGGVDIPTFVVDFDGYGLGASVTLDSGVQAALTYARHDVGEATITHTGIGVAYAMDAFAVGANWGQYDVDGYGIDTSLSGYGLAASYSLGGGASIHLGFGGGDSDSTYSFGLNMSF